MTCHNNLSHTSGSLPLLYCFVLFSPSLSVITVQKGWWFSTHEQWKALLLPYVSDDLPVIKKLFANAEKVRTIDAVVNGSPGLMVSHLHSI